MSDLWIPHWQVGDSCHHSQFDARKAAFVDGGPAYRFVFLESAYNQVDWTTEPNESWDQLCVERARQLRQKYKKLKLYFSAGRDSGHVFRVFEKAGIPIDELVLPYSPYHPLRYEEHVKYVRPVAEELCRRNPGMVMREVVHDKAWQDKIYKNENWLTHSGRRTMLYCPYDWTKEVEHDPDYQSGTCGYIFGMEKPRIRLVNGEFVFQLIDKDLQVTASGLPEVEYFYWAPELPKLMVKQCWMLVNHFENKYPGCDTNFVHDFQYQKSGYYDELCYALGRGPAMAWEVGNGITKLWSNYHWSIQQHIAIAKEEKFKGLVEWQIIMDDLKRNWGHFFHDDDPMKGTIGIWGQPYFIKTQNEILSTS